MPGIPARAAVSAVNLAQSIRRYGHLAAQLDPLGTKPIGDPTLQPERHGLTEDDLRRIPATLVSSPLDRAVGEHAGTRGRPAPRLLLDDRLRLRAGVRAGGAAVAAQGRRRRRFREPADPIDPVALLERLTQVEAFERFLHRTFPGKTRFSIEGLDMLVPILDEVIGDAGRGRDRVRS